AIQPGDDVQGSPDVAVLSYALWQRKFGGDPAVIGRTVRLFDTPFRIVGVLSQDFVLPLAHTDAQAEVWMGLALPTEPPAMRGRFLRVIARLAPGVTMQRAQDEMAALARRLEAEDPEYMSNMSVNVVPLHEQLVGKVRRPLMIVLASVAILLLIACVNVANLLLSRASTRRKEMAIRAALGASRGRLVRQLLTESLVLSLVGAMLGLLFAVYGTTLLVRFIPDPSILPRLDEISVDGSTVGVTALVAMATALLFGIAPAIDASRADLQNVLRSSSRSSTSGRGGKRFRDFLVASEIALAVVLLVSAGLLLKSFRELLSVDPGLNTGNALTMLVSIPSQTYGEDAQRTRFFEELFRRMRAVPGVTSAGATQMMPFVGLGRVDGFKIIGRPPAAIGDEPNAAMRAVGGDYFHAIGMKLLSGRVFDARDAARRTYVVDQTFVQKYFPKENPLGRQLSIVWGPGDPPSVGEIVGVVSSVRAYGLDKDPEPTLFVHYAFAPPSRLTVIARTKENPSTLAPIVTKIVRSMDGNATVSEVRTLDALVMKTVARPKFNATLLTLFSALGLTLAAIGIYGVLAYSVAQRTQEIGVRMAIGAQPGQVMKLVSREGMQIAVIGLIAGTLAAIAATRLLQSLLFGVSASDPLVIVLVWLGVAAVAFLATYIPARRATRVDPLIALRAE
nr:ABC transporter permease [Acidobacteriota bacterium]